MAEDVKVRPSLRATYLLNQPPLVPQVTADMQRLADYLRDKGLVREDGPDGEIVIRRIQH